MIIVFGSNVLDMFFNVADLPPHDTALHLDTHVEAPGGKGANQAIAAARAGSKVKFFGALGEGGHGRQMYKNLASYNIDVSGIKFTEVPSAVAAIFVDKTDGTHKIVVSQGANKLATQEQIQDDDLTKDTVLLLQGELAIAETERLIARGKEKSSRVVVNLAPVAPLSKTALNNIDYLILNEHEADGVGAQHGIPTTDKIAFGKEMSKRFNVSTIITLGGDGAICCTGNDVYEVSTLKIKPVDTVGAGDAFSGFFASGLDQGLPLEEALKRASVAGALACTKIGAQTALPAANDVQDHLGQITVRRQSA